MMRSFLRKISNMLVRACDLNENSLNLGLNSVEHEKPRILFIQIIQLLDGSNTILHCVVMLLLCSHTLL